MSIYDDALPWLRAGYSTLTEVGGQSFRITASAETAIHTGRRRYKLECRRCNAVVHEATTGPLEQAEVHVREREREPQRCISPEAT